MERKRKLFSKIYDKHIDRIYRFVFFRVKTKEIAEDLTSEAFSKTWAVYRERGEEREVEVSFPTDYLNKEVAGKTVHFKVHLKGIKEKIVPELMKRFGHKNILSVPRLTKLVVSMRIKKL